MAPKALRAAALVKQVPRFDAMELGADGRLRSEGPELEKNPYCRRAVSQGVQLARKTGGTCTVITLGPPAGYTREDDRKVTDKAWLPRARQVGITGRSIRPRLYVSIGAAGKFNRSVGFRGAGTELAINRQPDALIFGVADVGIVADWREVVPVLEARLREVVG